MRDLLTELMVNTDKFDQGHMEYFEDCDQEEREERLTLFDRDAKTWNIEEKDPFSGRIIK